MKSWLHYLVQGGGVVLQIINVLYPFLPQKWQLAAAAGITAAQAVAGVIAPHYNPDGTPAELPYRGA